MTSTTPRARGEPPAWPTYEVRERDFGTFVSLPQRLGMRDVARRSVTPAAIERTLEPAARAGDGGPDVRYFTVRRGGEPIGRVAVFIGDGGRDGDPRPGDPRPAMLGLLCAEADPEGVRFLVEIAADWAASRGCLRLIADVAPDGSPHPVPTSLHSILMEMGFGPGPGASRFECRLLDPDPLPALQPIGVSWRPVDRRAPWRGVHGLLGSDRIAEALCEPARPPRRWSRARLRPTEVHLGRFVVAETHRARGIGVRLAVELANALRAGGVERLGVGPVLDGQVPARRILQHVAARRVSRFRLLEMAL